MRSRYVPVAIRLFVSSFLELHNLCSTFRIQRPAVGVSAINLGAATANERLAKVTEKEAAIFV